MDLIDDSPAPSNIPEFSVSDLSGAIKRTLEGEFGRVRVRGEIGRVFRARSGHLYYDLKDANNVLACTTWKGQIGGLGVDPEEGLEVVVTGRLSAFGAQSKYNLNVDAMEVAGAGALMALLEKRKAQLAAEGLFEASRKHRLPYLPRTIGVITSPSGAVIRDILHRLRDRFPSRVLVWPVAVQGKACAPEVARAIAGFNAIAAGDAIPKPDLLIVARGGGSLEDLWGFNEEIVARAAAVSRIPLISAVGHETDTTLIDFVSDRRAPTPTAAAEIAVPVRLDLVSTLRSYDARLDQALREAVSKRQQRLTDVSRGLPRPDQLLAPFVQRVDYAGARLPDAARRAIAAPRVRLSRMEGRLSVDLLRGRIANEARRLTGLKARLHPAPRRRIGVARERLAWIGGRLNVATFTKRLADQRQRLEAVSAKLSRHAAQNLEGRQAKLTALDRLLTSLSYRATLARGYAVVRGDGAVITTRDAAKAAKSVEIEFQDGRVALGAGAPRKARKSSDPDDQGSLF